MRVWSRLCSVLSWAFFIFTLFTQGLLILSLWMPPFFKSLFPAGWRVNPESAASLPWLIAGFFLFVAGFFLFRFLKPGRWIWFAAMVAGALLLAGVGLYLKVILPETILANDQISGYDSAFKLVWRHFTAILVVLFHLLAVLFAQKADDAQLRREVFEEMKDEKPKYE